jgi:hypothetical protein
VEHGMNVKYFVDDREKDPIRKTLCENAPNVAVVTDDAKQFRILLRTTRRSQYLIDQLLAESGGMCFVPGCGFDDIFPPLVGGRSQSLPVQTPRSFSFQLICGDARVWIATEIVESLIEDCFLLRREIRILNFDRATHQLLSFRE